MNKFIRYWNQNRLMIIIVLIIIVLVIAVIQTVNYLLGNINEPLIQTEEKIPDLSRPTESVLSGEKVPEENSHENTNVIK